MSNGSEAAILYLWSRGHSGGSGRLIARPFGNSERAVPILVIDEAWRTGHDEARSWHPAITEVNPNEGDRSMQTHLPEGVDLGPIQILAVNSAVASKGSIHDDEKAREMGYAGGFVPGSTVLGYMSRWMHKSFGTRWYEEATLTARLRRPVYEGAEVTVDGHVSEESAGTSDGRMTVDLWVLTPDGTVAAVGQASCRVGSAE